MQSANESSAAGGSASSQAVALSAASETMPAPRARFDFVCLTPRADRIDEVIAVQAKIAKLRDSVENAWFVTPFTKRKQRKIDELHEMMCSDLMVEKWRDTAYNVVTTQGKNDLLDKYFAGSAYTAAWYCRLISSISYTAVAAGDTSAQINGTNGWKEAGPTNAPASGANGVALTFAAASGGSKATSAASSFTFTSGGTIKGMFGSTTQAKDATTGILYNAVLFTGGDRAVLTNDVVNVSVTYTIT